jgi:hypothetical protein
MCSRSKIKARAALLAGGLMLAGCSDLYLDRRETIMPSAGDNIAINRAAQMVDPWPPASADKNIAFNGEVMQSAVERYRQGRVIPPTNATTSSVAYQRAQAAAANTTSTVQSATAAPAQPAPSNWAAPPPPTIK